MLFSEFNNIEILDKNKQKEFNRILNKHSKYYIEFLLKIQSEENISILIDYLLTCSLTYLQNCSPDDFFIDYLNSKTEQLENPENLYISENDPIPSYTENEQYVFVPVIDNNNDISVYSFDTIDIPT